MLNKKEIIKITQEKKQLKTNDIAEIFNVSRQYASSIIRKLVAKGELIKVGSTRNAFYILPEYAQKHSEIIPTRIKKRLNNVNLEEHKIIDEIKNQFTSISKLNENIFSIFTYAFSEMLNNAIEHSKSDFIEVEVMVENEQLTFTINDFGIGVFKNIMQSKKLKSELEAIQDLLKGKTTTNPKSHSGEGIFFTSKVADIFNLESFGYRLVINSKLNDVFLIKTKNYKKGTYVKFSLDLSSSKHLNDVFKKYTDSSNGGGYGFNKTEVKIKLYTLGGIYISRSQARRVLTGLEKFSTVIFDFDKVELVGQAFADEIFRVFSSKYPKIKLQPINMNEAVKFMVDRVGN